MRNQLVALLISAWLCWSCAWLCSTVVPNPNCIASLPNPKQGWIVPAIAE
jgi:hypothetical protein